LWQYIIWLLSLAFIRLTLFDPVHLKMVGRQEYWLLGIIILSVLVILAAVVRFARVMDVDSNPDY